MPMSWRENRTRSREHSPVGRIANLLTPVFRLCHSQFFKAAIPPPGLRGVTPTLDPFTGEAKEVWTGQSSNYWQNGRGDVVNSVNAPQGNWQQMTVTGP